MAYYLAIAYIWQQDLCSRARWFGILTDQLRVAISITAASALLCPPVFAALNRPVRTILHTAYPPVLDDVPFSIWSQYLSLPTLNEQGHTAFVANGLGQAILSEAGGQGLELIARHGDPAPGAIGYSFASLYHPALNDQGQIAFNGLLVDESNNLAGWGIWSADPKLSVSLVARPGDSIPDRTGTFFYSVGSPSVTTVNPPLLGNDGVIAFNAYVHTPSFLFAGAVVSSRPSDGELRAVVSRVDVAPNTNGAVFNGIATTALNDHGSSVFVTGLIHLDGEVSNDSVLWLNTKANGLSDVVRSGDVAPGVPEAEFGQGFRMMTLNNSGEIAFWVRIKGQHIDWPSASGIWAGTKERLRLVATTESTPPGSSNGRFRVFRNLVLNRAGDTSFVGEFAGENGDSIGIWSEGQHGGLQIVALSGTEAPGTHGTTFENFGNLTMNGSGQVAFAGRLASGSNKAGIWAQDSGGVLRLIVREGQQLDVSPGLDVDLRTVSYVSFIGGTGNEDGRPSAFNDLGQLAFFASFTDGSAGVFVSNVLVIPEPDSLHSVTIIGILAAALIRPRASPARRRDVLQRPAQLDV